MAVAPVAGAAAHAPLDDGFALEIADVVDEGGEAVTLEGVTWSLSADGRALTVANSSSAELVVLGESADEPFLLATDSVLSVNIRSFSATAVRGADADAADRADLMDLVWGRVEPSWVPLPAGAEWDDTRTGGGHLPDHSGVRDGAVVADWELPFTYEGRPHLLRGRTVAVGDPGQTGWGWRLTLAAAVLLVAAALAWAILRRRARPTTGRPPERGSERPSRRAGAVVKRRAPAE